MAKSRKDSRGYVLRTGESQRKDGRYSCLLYRFR
ncbi:MAG: integrase DNA-binding domain-containing protein [Mediterraneibacter gnavus]